MTKSDEHYMQQALKEAQKAFDEGEVPIGAIIVMQDKIIARAYNQVEKLNDSTAHAEIIGSFTKTNHIGILGTNGTVQSQSYPIEINKFFPAVKVFQQACPLWVPLVENNEFENSGAYYFIKRDIDNLIDQSKDIDTILLACTHYPVLLKKIQKFSPHTINIISQGEIIANSLKDYLHRHPEIEEKCGKNGKVELFTTDTEADFDLHSETFFGKALRSKHLKLE